MSGMAKLGQHWPEAGGRHSWYAPACLDADVKAELKALYHSHKLREEIIVGELRKIPGVGVKTEQDLIRLGYPTIASLKNADPEEIYRRDCEMRGMLIDRCQLYVYRCAVYYAGTPNPASEKLKWWNWKD